MDNFSKNYVFFWSDADYYTYAFKDILSLENVRFFRKMYHGGNIFVSQIHKFHQSSKINKIVKLPFRKQWRYFYFKDDFQTKKPIVFIFHGYYYWLRAIDYFSFLRRQYPGCICVLILMDTVDSYLKYFKGKYYGDFEVDYIKKQFDYVLTYNKIDAEKYYFTYYPGIYSKLDWIKKGSEDTDILFVGRAKDRLEKIHNIYNLLIHCGFKCDFYVVDVPDHLQIYPGIHYNSVITYTELLQHIEKTRGILEIVQTGSNGFTLRLEEALAYNKNLITDNPIISEIKYSTSPKIYYLKEGCSIDRNLYLYHADMDYGYKEEYSPVQLLKYIETLFG